jgi:hypothetical protein
VNDQLDVLPIDGLPETRRACDPPGLGATSLRYQPKIVSVRAAVTTSFRVLRHTRSHFAELSRDNLGEKVLILIVALHPSVAPPPCKNLRHPFSWPFKIGFSAAKYSLSKADPGPRSR